MTQDIVISFIITVYNNEKFVANAIESIMSQECDEIELVIVDDGSTDNTPVILKKYEEKSDKIRVIRQDNQWIYAGFNRGISEAKGKYFYIVNSDDKLKNGAVSMLLDVIKKYNQPDVIWTNIEPSTCDENQNVIERDVWKYGSLINEEAYYPDRQSVRQAWPFFLSSRLAINQANLYKRELGLNNPFRNDYTTGDTFFNLGIAEQIETAYVISTQLYEHLIYNSDSMNASIGKYYDYEHRMYNEIYLRYIDLFKKWGLNFNLYEKTLKEFRLRAYTREIKNLNSNRCPFYLSQKIKCVLNDYQDAVICECGSGQFRNELESRTLAGIGDIIGLSNLSDCDEMSFVKDLVRLRYEEKPISDKESIKESIYHNPNNPNKIGASYIETGM